jgi:hypothetical protein
MAADGTDGAQVSGVTSTTTPVDAAARVHAALDPASRAMVVRVRVPTGGVAPWLERGAVLMPAPIGDLSAFTSKEQIETTLRQAGIDIDALLQANGLWLLKALVLGDVILAASDDGRVHAYGAVEGAYRWDHATESHCVPVRWLTTGLPRVVAGHEAKWRLNAVCEVRRDALWTMLMSTPPPLPAAPPFPQIRAKIANEGLRIEERTLRRYHLALRARGFVVLAGVSGTGKTWLAEAYARAVGAEHLLVAVAPNWTTNEDLLGYFNPLKAVFQPTAFTGFLQRAAEEYEAAKAEQRDARTYHLVLDEMNLARVEYYFAKFLSAMEVRARAETALLELYPGHSVQLTPNLAFIGTVNVDETTHMFADKVYDRAQLIELDSPRATLEAHVASQPFAKLALDVWDAVREVAPFAFRVLDDIAVYVREATALEVPWQDALDEQIVQKILPKVKGNDARVGGALERVIELSAEALPLTRTRASQMLEGYRVHGFVSFF